MRFLCLLSIVFLALLDCWAGEARPVRIHRALLVGIEDYPPPQTALPGVRSDVALVMEALTSKHGVLDPAAVRVLTDAAASKANIVRVFEEWLVQGTRPGDRVLFYFSGHGIQVWDEDGDELDDGIDEALVCYDTSYAYQRRIKREFKGHVGYALSAKGARNALLDDEIHELFGRLKGRTVFFISDSCHAGTVHKQVHPFFVQNKIPIQPPAPKGLLEPRTAGREVRPFTTDEPTSMGSDLAAPGVTLFALTASDDSQPAQLGKFRDEPSGYHSVFSWFLYHGLGGEADQDKNGAVSCAELYDYVCREIDRNGYTQVPQAYFATRGVRALPFAPAGKVMPAGKPRSLGLACLFKRERGVTATMEAKMKADLTARLPFLVWVSQADEPSCLITVEKHGGRIAGRLSDSTGVNWESHVSADLDRVLEDVAGNLRAYHVQSRLTTMANRHTRMLVDVTMKKLSSGGKRAKKGDSVTLEIRAEHAGYPYVLNVDTMGVLHPLYPFPAKPHTRLAQGKAIRIGANNAIVVQEPFGKEAVVVFHLENRSSRMAELWEPDQVGNASARGWTAQKRFLEVLTEELFPAGDIRTDWTSDSLLFETFKE